MKKIKNIEFLRIIGCLAVVIFHLGVFLTNNFPDIDIFSKLHKSSCNGRLAVDLFFIISGFLFVYTLNLKQSTWDFFKKKIIRLYPTFLFITLFCIIFSLFGLARVNIFSCILTIFCLNGTSLTLNYGFFVPFWYVSALIWTLLLLFYLLKNFDKKVVNLLIAFSVFISYSLIIQHGNGHFGGNKEVLFYFVNIGMLRAFGGIGIGYFIGEWYKNNVKNIKSLNFNPFRKVFFSCFELLLIALLSIGLIFHKLHYGNHFLYIIFFTLTIILFLIKQGIFSKILNNNFITNIAKYSYSIYLIHAQIFPIIKNSLNRISENFIPAHPIITYEIMLFSSIILGVTIYHLVEKPCTIFLKNKFISKTQ